jgi:hypothetical protein
MIFVTDMGLKENIQGPAVFFAQLKSGGIDIVLGAGFSERTPQKERHDRNSTWCSVFC